MKKHIGIVLKTDMPYKRIAHILDWELGKIRCVPQKSTSSKYAPNNEPMLLGALITYFVNKKSLYFIDNIELLHAPFEQAINDILFFHHILETCCHFSPLYKPNQEIFNLLNWLLFYSNMIESKINKQLFLFKLFTQLGLYPEGVLFQSPYFCSLVTESIDTIIVKKLHLKNENDLNNWLHHCIKTEPEFNNFKTVNLLYKSGFFI